ncbi:hypothetical protein MPSEU_000309100 [Mayamaea pseudoterrestris]|nr:hypothetical protein MPSEU_000309100 [Mayamaea pseudoterrestris]
MASQRRSTRVQIQQAVAESLSSVANGGAAAAAPAAAAAAAVDPVASAAVDESSVPRKRDQASKRKQSSQKEQQAETNIDVESDGVGDADFGDSSSEDEEEAVEKAKQPEPKRLKKITGSMAVAKWTKPKASSPKVSKEEEGTVAASSQEQQEQVSPSIPKKSSSSNAIPRRKQNELAPQSLLVAHLKPASVFDTTKSTFSTKPISSTLSSSTTARSSSQSSKPVAKTTTAAAAAPSSLPVAPPMNNNIGSRAMGGNRSKTPPPPPYKSSSATSVQGLPKHYQERPGIKEKATTEAARLPPTDLHQRQYNMPPPQQQQQQQPLKQVTPLERQAMTYMHEFCRNMRERDDRFKYFKTIRSVDLGGSFLWRSFDDPARFDFFDKNERGEIVLQPKQPMFPEEFAPGMMKEHPLSWWGIADPAVGEGKYKPAGTATATAGSEAKQAPSNAPLPSAARMDPSRLAAAAPDPLQYAPPAARGNYPWNSGPPPFAGPNQPPRRHHSYNNNAPPMQPPPRRQNYHPPARR